MRRALTALAGAAAAIMTMTAATGAAAAAVHHLPSPDGRITVAVHDGAPLSYDVLHDGKPLLARATLSLDVDHVALGARADVVATRFASVDRRVEPPVRIKAAVLADRYNELRLECAGGYTVTFRAYDQGVAYRFETALPASKVKVYGEQATFAFAADADARYPQEEGFFSHNERIFKPLRLSAIAPAALASIPAIVETAAGPRVAIAESDVEDYPGLWLRGTGGPALAATFPPYPRKEKRLNDRDVKVVQAADYIAQTRGARTYPWRVLGIAARDADLVASTLVYLLAAPSRIADTSWIRPGKVAWDWWNALNLRGVDFKPGVNTRTYLHYIDFAAAHGIEYVILDEGWYRLGNLLKVTPGLDLDAVLAHARGKKVGIILWVIWKTFEDQMPAALAQFQRWGVAGVKVDFMQRDDQPTMAFYHRAARELAARKMLVDFHGAIRPILLARTWPNLVNTEGVQGLEHVKWSKATDPEHDLTLPFTRMFLGPMDYTPGAMVNAAADAFRIDFKSPMSMGTRCHQLAMYVVYESPLQMLADAPTSYAREPETMELLSAVPTVWDETRALDGRTGDYVVVARRRGRDWWLAAMTDWTARELPVALSSLLGDGRFQMTAYEDGADAARNGSAYRKTAAAVDRTTRLTLKLSPGGGWVARLSPR